jgi:hypothetical protein
MTELSILRCLVNTEGKGETLISLFKPPVFSFAIVLRLACLNLQIKSLKRRTDMFSKRRIALFISVVLVLVAGILIITSFAMADSNRKPERLIGAWYLDGISSLGDQIHALATFNADGTMSEDQLGAFETSGHGIWEMDKQGKVRFTAVELTWVETPSFAYTGKFVVTQALKRNAATDTWSGPFKLNIYDPDNNSIVEATGTVTLTRITLLPAP